MRRAVLRDLDDTAGMLTESRSVGVTGRLQRRPGLDRKSQRIWLLRSTQRTPHCLPELTVPSALLHGLRPVEVVHSHRSTIEHEGHQRVQPKPWTTTNAPAWRRSLTSPPNWSPSQRPMPGSHR